MRGTEIDTLWNDAYGNKQRTEDGQVYTGSVLEHILIQQLAAFYDVGVHNIYRLRGADWNDALDMAAENGESVAFTWFYVKKFDAEIQLVVHTDTSSVLNVLSVNHIFLVKF